MKDMKSTLVILLASFFMLLSLPILARDSDDSCAPCFDDGRGTCCDSFWGIAAETRVAYYRPSSKRVRHIYGDGWADYQLELSKSFKNFGGLESLSGCGFLQDMEGRIWTGVSGFSRHGHSIGFHDKTKIQLLPISLGLKIYYPILGNTKVFIGGAACYSFLHIHDHSDYVHQHIRKESWGGIFQSGLTYDICNWAVASIFFDYFFQHFRFHNKYNNSSSDLSDYDSSSSHYVERVGLNMNGFKVGVGLGFRF